MIRPQPKTTGETADAGNGSLTTTLRAVAGPYLKRLRTISPLRRPPVPDDPYEVPRIVTDPQDCYFYHTMEIPGLGLVEGQWDLRNGVDEYTGGIDYANKRVLDVGTASGFFCFALEALGAEVVAYDLSEAQSWDHVPMATVDAEAMASERRAIMRKINNGYWFAHRALKSSARVAYGTVYEIPESIGPVDIATYFSVLLHVRDPFLALEKGVRLARETVVVTEMLNPYRRGMQPVLDMGAVLPKMEFVPEFSKDGPVDTWWYLTPGLIQAFLGVLGFGRSRVSTHVQTARWGEEELFTVVAHRTAGEAVGS